MRPIIGKKVLFVVCQRDFRDEELLEPSREIQAAGGIVVVAAHERGTAQGKLGAKVAVELAIEDAKASSFDAVVVVGGPGTPTWLWPDADLHTLLRDAKAKNKVVGGICLSGATLAIAGVLRDVEATTWVSDESMEAMRQGGARYVEKPVVTSGKIVTASGPKAAREFGKALVAALSAG